MFLSTKSPIEWKKSLGWREKETPLCEYGGEVFSGVSLIAFCLNGQIRGASADYQRFAVLAGPEEELENCSPPPNIAYLVFLLAFEIR